MSFTLLALAVGAAKVVNALEDKPRKNYKKKYKKNYRKNDSWLDLAWFSDHNQSL